MIAHLLSSARNLQQDLPFLQAITDTIHEHNGHLARDWVNTAAVRVIKNNRRDDATTDWAVIHQENCAAIIYADVIVVEATVYGYMQGFYTAFAALHHKPTLVVLRQNPTRKLPILSIGQDDLVIKEYETIGQLQKIVSAFFKDTLTTTTPLDAKLKLDQATRRQIDKVAKETGQAKDVIIGDIVTKSLAK